MVKKKSHEEGHENKVPGENIPETQDIKETEAAEQPETRAEKDQAAENNQVEELTVKLTEMQDKYIRLSAEFDNYRKRTLREKIELTKSAGESVLISILPVVDDFDRAMISLRDTENCAAVKEGLQLIYTKLNDFLKQNGVKEMEVLNTPFDSEMHEAVTNIPVDNDEMKGKVVDVVQKGYVLNEKVIRFPKVVVGE